MSGKRGKRLRRGAGATAPPAALARKWIWDVPTRSSHWAIALLFGFLFLSGRFALFPSVAHLWAGYLLLVAVVFRLIWGLVGSDSARFRHMLYAPRAVAGYLRLLRSSSPTLWPGHNPVGGLSSLLLLALLLIQCVTGLFVETWGDIRGPLAERVDRPTMQWLGDLHDLLSWPLLVVVLVHIAATVYYLLGKRENRIAGIFGDGRVPLREEPGLAFASSGRAWLALAASVALVIAIVRFGPAV